MPSLLVLILAVELAVQLINTIGAASINNLVCSFNPPNTQPCDGAEKSERADLSSSSYGASLYPCPSRLLVNSQRNASNNKNTSPSDEI